MSSLQHQEEQLYNGISLTVSCSWQQKEAEEVRGETNSNNNSNNDFTVTSPNTNANTHTPVATSNNEEVQEKEDGIFTRACVRCPAWCHVLVASDDPTDVSWQAEAEALLLHPTRPQERHEHSSSSSPCRLAAATHLASAPAVAALPAGSPAPWIHIDNGSTSTRTCADNSPKTENNSRHVRDILAVCLKTNARLLEVHAGGPPTQLALPSPLCFSDTGSTAVDTAAQPPPPPLLTHEAEAEVTDNEEYEEEEEEEEREETEKKQESVGRDESEGEEGKKGRRQQGTHRQQQQQQQAVPLTPQRAFLHFMVGGAGVPLLPAGAAVTLKLFGRRPRDCVCVRAACIVLGPARAAAASGSDEDDEEEGEEEEEGVKRLHHEQQQQQQQQQQHGRGPHLPTSPHGNTNSNRSGNAGRQDDAQAMAVMVAAMMAEQRRQWRQQSQALNEEVGALRQRVLSLEAALANSVEMFTRRLEALEGEREGRQQTMAEATTATSVAATAEEEEGMTTQSPSDTIPQRSAAETPDTATAAEVISEAKEQQIQTEKKAEEEEEEEKGLNEKDAQLQHQRGSDEDDDVITDDQNAVPATAYVGVGGRDVNVGASESSSLTPRSEDFPTTEEE